MDIEGKTVLLLGGTGQVGTAIARELLPLAPYRMIIGGLREKEVRLAVEQLAREEGTERVELVPEWGNILVRTSHAHLSRKELLGSPEQRGELLDDLFGPMDEELVERSALCSLLERESPEVVIDCINTATAIAYQDLFSSAERIRGLGETVQGPSRAEIETHLSTLYLPQLIRHMQLLLEGMRRAGTRAYLKIGTSGTGGMGLNIPFTHSEVRPSPALLSKASLAGAQSLLLFLMGRTPDAPAVTELKPSAAISWKRIGYGPVRRGGERIERWDATRPVPVEEAFGADAEESYERSDGVLESVYLDAGENGYFSVSEFETISSLGMMELVTPEEIAEYAVSEIQGRSTGRDIVAALDGSVFGPTYRGGVMREAALQRMEELEEEHGVRSVAFEMLGPPRLSKLLYEAAILERLFPDLEAAAGLDPDEVAAEAGRMIDEDDRLRSDILSVGLPILLADGDSLLRGPLIEANPDREAELDVDRWADRGWVDLRPANWEVWKGRCAEYLERIVRPAGAEAGSRSDLDVRARSGRIRPGALGAYVLEREDGGKRTKR